MEKPISFAVRLITAIALGLLVRSSMAQERCVADGDTALAANGVYGPVLGIKVEPQLARVIQIRQTRDGHFPWWSIGELKVFPEGSDTPLVRADYQAYRGEPNNQPALRALDGKLWTNWQTGARQNSTQSYTLELNEPTVIDCISLHTPNKPNDYPRGYEVSIWPDLEGYYADNGTVQNSEVTFRFSAVQAQYLRLRQTGTRGAWWAISELDVYADDGLTKLPRNGDWAASATHSAAYRGETPDKAIDGSRATVWSTGKAQTGDEHFQVSLGAMKTIGGVRAVSVNADSSRNDYPAGLALELSHDGVTWFDPQSPPEIEPVIDATSLGAHFVTTEVDFGAGRILSDEHWHLLGLTTRGFKRFQTISQVLVRKPGQQPRIVIAASLNAEDADGTVRGNEDGLIYEAILNANGSVTPVAYTVYPECKEMIGLTRGPDDAVAALCRSSKEVVNDYHANGVAFTDLQQEYIDHRNTTKYDGKVDLDFLWLYEWRDGDTSGTPDRYIVSKNVGSAELGEFEMCSVEHRYDISAKIGNCFINNSDALECHETDRAFAVNQNTGSDVAAPANISGYFIERFNDDGGVGTRGWFNSGGPGHTLHNRLACNTSTNESAVMIAADGSSIAPFFGLNIATVNKQGTQRGNEQPTFLHLQTAGGGGGVTKGGPGALHPLGDGYIGIVVGAEGNAALGELDYERNGEPNEPLLKIGIAKFDANGSLLDPEQSVKWLIDAAPHYVSYPQLVPLPNGNFLLGYGVMAANHSEGRAYAELKPQLQHPTAFWIGEIDAEGNEVNAPVRLPAGVAWGEFDQLVTDHEGRVVWSQPGTTGATLRIHSFEYEDYFTTAVQNTLGPSDETVLCSSGQAATRVVLASEMSANGQPHAARGLQVSCDFLDWSGPSFQQISNDFLFSPDASLGHIRQVTPAVCEGLGNALTGLRIAGDLSLLSDCHFERGRQLASGAVGACNANQVLKGFHIWYERDNEGARTEAAPIAHVSNICATFDELESEKEGIVSVSGFLETESLECAPGQVASVATLMSGTSDYFATRDRFGAVRLQCRDVFDNLAGNAFSTLGGAFASADFETALSAGDALEYLGLGPQMALDGAGFDDVLAVCPRGDQRMTGLALRYDVGQQVYVGALPICKQSVETLTCDGVDGIARADVYGLVGSPSDHLAEVSVRCGSTDSSDAASTIVRSRIDANADRTRTVQAVPHAPYLADQERLANSSFTLATCEVDQVVDSLRLTYDDRLEAYIHVSPLCAVGPMLVANASVTRPTGDGRVRHCDNSIEIDIKYREAPGFFSAIGSLFGGSTQAQLQIVQYSQDYLTVGRHDGGVGWLRSYRARKDARHNANRCFDRVFYDGKKPGEEGSCNNANVWTQASADSGEVPADARERDFESLFGSNWTLKGAVRDAARQSGACDAFSDEREKFYVTVDYDSRNPTGHGCLADKIRYTNFSFDEICGAPPLNDDDWDGDGILNTDEFPGCEDDNRQECALLRAQATAVLNELDDAALPGAEFRVNALYSDLSDGRVTCRELVELYAESSGVQPRNYYHICGWSEPYIEQAANLPTVWLRGDDYSEATVTWSGYLDRPDFIAPAGVNGSIPSTDSLGGLAAVRFDGADALVSHPDATVEVGSHFVSFAVYENHRDSTELVNPATGIANSVWTETSAEQLAARHEMSYGVPKNETVIEVVESIELENGDLSVLKWRNGVLVANELYEAQDKPAGALAALAIGCDHVFSDPENLGAAWSVESCSQFSLGELLIYDGVLSPWERSNIEAYLAQRWGSSSDDLWVSNKDHFRSCLHERGGVQPGSAADAFVQVAADDVFFDSVDAECNFDFEHPYFTLDVPNSQWHRGLESHFWSKLTLGLAECGAQGYVGARTGAVAGAFFEGVGAVPGAVVGAVGGCALGAIHAVFTVAVIEAAQDSKDNVSTTHREPDTSPAFNCATGVGDATMSCSASDYANQVAAESPSLLHRISNAAKSTLQYQDRRRHYKAELQPGDCRVVEETDPDSEAEIGELVRGASAECCVVSQFISNDDERDIEHSLSSCDVQMKIPCQVAALDVNEEVNYIGFLGGVAQFTTDRILYTQQEYPLWQAEYACDFEFSKKLIDDRQVYRDSGYVAEKAIPLSQFATALNRFQRDWNQFVDWFVNRAENVIEQADPFPARGRPITIEIELLDEEPQNRRLTSGPPTRISGLASTTRVDVVSQADSTLSQDRESLKRKRDEELDDRESKRQVSEAQPQTMAELTVKAFDTGQGNCNLIQCTNIQTGVSQSAILDCGSSARGGAEFNKFNITGALLAEGFTHASPIYLSHPDKDHHSLFKYIWGATPGANYNLLHRPTRMYAGGTAAQYQVRKRVSEFLRAAMNAAPAVPINGGAFTHRAPMAPNTGFASVNFPEWARPAAPQVLQAFPACGATLHAADVNNNHYDNADPTDGPARNGRSAILVLKTNDNKFATIFPGDALQQTESDAIGRVAPLIAGASVKILMASHHGSAENGSNHQAWIDAIAPQFVVFSSKLEKHFHPANEVVHRYHARLQAQAINVASTDALTTLHTVTSGFGTPPAAFAYQTSTRIFGTNDQGTATSVWAIPDNSAGGPPAPNVHTFRVSNKGAGAPVPMITTRVP